MKWPEEGDVMSRKLALALAVPGTLRWPVLVCVYLGQATGLSSLLSRDADAPTSPGAASYSHIAEADHMPSPPSEDGHFKWSAQQWDVGGQWMKADSCFSVLWGQFSPLLFPVRPASFHSDWSWDVK